MRNIEKSAVTESIKMVTWIVDSRLFRIITLGSGRKLAHRAHNNTRQQAGEDAVAYLDSVMVQGG
jgi:hypothetical protein